jgi:hypothetical protein
MQLEKGGDTKMIATIKCQSASDSSLCIITVDMKNAFQNVIKEKGCRRYENTQSLGQSGMLYIVKLPARPSSGLVVVTDNT